MGSSDRYHESAEAIATQQARLANLREQIEAINRRIPQEQRVAAAILELQQLSNEITTAVNTLRDLIEKADKIGHQFTGDWKAINPKAVHSNLVERAYNINKLPTVKMLNEGAIYIS
jgi:hypothetical protein